MDAEPISTENFTVVHVHWNLLGEVFGLGLCQRKHTIKRAALKFKYFVALTTDLKFRRRAICCPTVVCSPAKQMS